MNQSQNFKRPLVRILSAIHALTESDTTSKVRTKDKAFKVACNSKYQHQLAKFGENVLNSELMKKAEEFLKEFVGNKESLSMGIATFDRLRHFVFHSENKKDFAIEKLPCTSETIRLHIKRAFLQTHKWIYSPLLERISLFPWNYGYECEEDKGLVIPQIMCQ